MASLYTVAQLNAITKARATGVTSVSFENHRTDYRTLDEMDRIIASMKADLQANGDLPADSPTPLRRVRLLTMKGL
jgi:hypothetical protein